MHKQPYLGRIALCIRKKTSKSGEIWAFYGMLCSCSTVVYTSPNMDNGYITIIAVIYLILIISNQLELMSMRGIC